MARSSLGSLTVSLLMLTGQFETDSGRAAKLAEKRAKEIDAAFAKAGRNIGIGLAAGFGVATTALGVYIKNAAESERVQAQLTSRIRDTSGAAQRSLAQLNAEAQKLMNASIFDDEAIGGAQAILLTFKQIQGVNFDRATAAVLDLSTAMGTDLNSAALQLGKALNDPARGLAALGRAGIQFSADQTKTINAMVKSNDVADAQRLILKELESQMGTAAEAARDTLGGAVKALGNSFDNLMEGDAGGAGLTGARQALESLIDTLNDPDVKRGADATAEGLLAVANAAIKVVSWVGNAGSALAEYFADDVDKGLVSLKNKREDLETELFKVQRYNNNSLPIFRNTGAENDLKAEIARLDGLIAERKAQAAKAAADASHSAPYDPDRGQVITITAPAAAAVISDQAKAAKKAAEDYRDLMAADKDLYEQFTNNAQVPKEASDEWLDMAAQLDGPVAQAQREHKKRIDEITKTGIAAGVSWDRINAAIAKENELYAQQTPMAQAARQAAEEYQQSWLNAVDSVGHAFGDWMTGTISSFKDFGRTLVDIAKRWGSDLIGKGLSRLLNGGFADAGSTSSGAGGWLAQLIGGSQTLQKVAGWFGFGGGTAPAATGMGWANAYGAGAQLATGAGVLLPQYGGGTLLGATGAAASGAAGGNGGLGSLLSAAGMFKQGTIGKFLTSPAAPWLSAAAGAYYGYRSTDDSTGKVLAGAAYGTAAYGVAAGVGGAVTGSAVAGSAAAGLSAVPVVGWIALAAIAVNAISGGKLFGTKYKLESAETNYGYGDNGIRGSTDVTKVREKALFGGKKHTTSTQALSDDARAALDEAFSAIDSAVTQAASQLGIAVPDLLAAQFTQEFDSKGKLKSEFGKIAGKTYREAQDAFNQRYLAENLLNVAGLAGGHAATVQQLANGYRGTPELLTDFSTLMLAIAGDAKAGKLLWDDTDAALTDATTALRGMQHAGESLAQTYQRVSEGVRSYADLIGGVRGELLTHGLSEYAQAQLQVELQYRSQVKQANDLAKALGLSGARAEDLASIEQLRAQRMADLQVQMDKQRDDFLGGLRLSDLGIGTDRTKRDDAFAQLQAAVAAGDQQRAQQLVQSALGFERNLAASGSDYNEFYGRVTDLYGQLDPANAGLGDSALQQLADTMDTLPQDIASALFQVLANTSIPLAPPPPTSAPPVRDPGAHNPKRDQGLGGPRDDVLDRIAQSTAIAADAATETLRLTRSRDLKRPA